MVVVQHKMRKRCLRHIGLVLPNHPHPPPPREKITISPFAKNIKQVYIIFVCNQQRTQASPRTPPALNIFVTHRRRSSAFAKNNIEQKNATKPAKKTNYLEIAPPLRFAQKNEKCLRLGGLSVAQIFGKTMSRNHAKRRVSRGYAILTQSLQ